MAKFLLTLAILCVFDAVLVKGFDKDAAIASFMAKMDECKGEVGATDDDVKEMIEKMPASSEEGKCLRSCIMKKFGVMDSNGKFAKAVAISFAEQFSDGSEDMMKVAHEIIDACGDIEVPANHCEAAAQYCKCFKEQAIAHGLDKFNL